jgi:arginine decarboxylase
MVDRLIDALRRLVEAAPSMEHQAPVDLPAPRSLELESVMRPRNAFFGRVEQVPVADAAGRVAAEIVSPTHPACRCWPPVSGPAKPSSTT